MIRVVILGAAALGCLALPSKRSAAQEPAPQSWSEIKCSRYEAAWSQAIELWDLNGVGREFIARHEAFLASGCAAKADVCPRSPEEYALANAMIVAAMNAGAASTFPPFACRD